MHEALPLPTHRFPPDQNNIITDTNHYLVDPPSTSFTGAVIAVYVLLVYETIILQFGFVTKLKLKLNNKRICCTENSTEQEI